MSNVLLVTVDSLRADHLGCYGYERNTSPMIDEIASESVSFDAYANANATRASFPSIMTSTYPLEYGGFDYLADERMTLATALSKAGHATGAFHSNLWLSREYNYDRGFDRFYDSKSDPSMLARLRTIVKLTLSNDSIVYTAFKSLYDATEEKAGVDIGQTYKDAKTITDRAIEWLTHINEPFFCWVHYMDVHHPYVPHKKALAALGVDINTTEREAIKLRRKMLDEPGALTDAEHQSLVDLYDAEIRYTDEQVGRLVEHVNDHFGAAETSIVITADHGEEFGEHGGYSHNSGMYDEVLHVPMILDLPANTSIETTGKQHELVELLDVAPTCCDLAGATTPDEYHGRSVIDAASSGTDARIISETTMGDDCKLALRTREWKYIWNRDSNETELYDLIADPEEQEDVRAENEDIAMKLRDELRAHTEELRESNANLPDVRMDSETKKRLKNLGYLE